MAFGHLPVVDGDVGSLQLLPLRQASCIKILQLARVSKDSFLFEVSNKAVNGARTDEIGEEQSITPDSLGAQNHQAHEGTRLAHLEEGK